MFGINFFSWIVVAEDKPEVIKNRQLWFNKRKSMSVSDFAFTNCSKKPGGISFEFYYLLV